MPRLSRRDEARPGRRPSEGQYLSMPQLQGGMTVEDWAGSGSYFEWSCPGRNQKELYRKGAASPPPRRSYPATARFSFIQSILRMQPLRRLKRHALGIKLPAFGERRSHLEFDFEHLKEYGGGRRAISFFPLTRIFGAAGGPSAGTGCSLCTP